MSNSLRRLKRQQDRDSNELPPEEQKLPTGRVVGDPLRGKFLSVPLLGWVAVRDRDRIPLVMLVLALLGESDHAMHGTLEVELPLYLDTEAATLAALERYGWAGTTWALGDPAPNGDEGLGEQLTGLISQVSQNLRATLLFASGATFTPAQEVEVTRAQGRFLMPPLEKPSEPPSTERVEALRRVVLEWRRFFAVEAVDA
jgi:hypothetical protein